ncbi:MAG: hypothetical protein COT24_03590 [Candidatus Kerfeldbacteria bacterium CG08_land_8_20_14_0_20_40_16]|uniref:Uncharacterized protein n=1 Tax=Candidatus Kerfeldbacteria bacterium CG08_land_8_20_14_0_20_40_16 TaxID=2014244 RepID=A0A2H0YVA6_9BACT|nr:MAG: hypothetical protein COT24_03590 [Candidatus Kerfeldbacteria bacterium CG08_land_8_20_14_0_20_40_16]
MTSRSGFPQIFLIIIISLIAIFVVVVMALGVWWYFQNYVEPNITGASSNVYTKCVKFCQDNKKCESSKIIGQKIVNGQCECDCLTIPSRNTNSDLNTNILNSEQENE